MLFVIIKLPKAHHMKDIFKDLSTERINKRIDTDSKTIDEIVDAFISEEEVIHKILKKNSISGTLVKACVAEVHRFIGKVIGKVKSEALGKKRRPLTVL